MLLLDVKFLNHLKSIFPISNRYNVLKMRPFSVKSWSPWMISFLISI